MFSIGHLIKCQKNMRCVSASKKRYLQRYFRKETTTHALLTGLPARSTQVQSGRQAK